MGKSAGMVSGYHYLPAFHVGLGRGPIDAYLEWRVAEKTAWRGELGASGTLHVNKPFLFGGDKDQGGVVGDLDLMFGEATQLPNPYLIDAFGPQVSAWRGIATMAYKGGRYGANNPYAQKHSSKIRKVLKGWDGDNPWYPDKAAIPMSPGQVIGIDQVWKYRVDDNSSADYSAADYDDSAWLEGAGGFGSFAPAGDLGIGTHVDAGLAGRTIWIRKTITGSGVPVLFDVFHDDGAWLYINGVEVPLTPTENYYWSQATVPGSDMSGTVTIVLKVVDGEPAGSDVAIYAGLKVTGFSPSLIGMNPAHILYYSRTDSERGRELRASINDESLTAAADRLYAEGFGLCTEYDPAKESPAEFEQRICAVIGGSFERSLTDGQWYLDLARGDYDIDALPVLTDDDVLDFKEQPSTLDRASNSISVRYFDVERKETVVTPPVRALALVRQFGEIQETLEYLEVPTAALATRIAERELRARITPTRGFELVTTPRTYAWRRNQYFRLQLPKRGIADMVCIVGQKERGVLKSGAINLVVAQDIYGMPDASYVEVEPGVDTRPPADPGLIDVERAFEASYFELARSLPRAELAALAPDAGFVLAVASSPAAGRDFTMTVATEGGAYDEAGTGYWSPTGLALTAVGLEAGPLAVALGAAYRLSAVQVGAPVLWDDEILRVDAVDVPASAVTLSRACADTVPRPHEAGSRVWFYDLHAASDATEYAAGETVDVKLLSNTGSDRLDPLLAPTLPVELNARANRPYPPAAVQINGVWPPAPTAGDLEIAYATRNRLMQADQLLAWSQPSVMAEAGTQYVVRVAKHSDGTPLAASVPSTDNPIVVAVDYEGLVDIEVLSIRDGVECLQPVAATLFHSAEAVAMLEVSGTYPSGEVGVPYVGALSVTGAIGALTVEVIAGALPPGLALTASGSTEIYGLPESDA